MHQERIWAYCEGKTPNGSGDTGKMVVRMQQQHLGTWEEERLKSRGRNVRADTGKLAQVSGVGRDICSKGNLKGVAGREGGLE